MSKGEDPDSSGLGKWFGWLIVVLIILALATVAYRATGQGLGVGALLPASGAVQPSVRTPSLVTLTGCDGDTGPTVDLSDSIIVTTGGTSGGSGTQLSPLSLTAALAGTGIMATTPNRVVLVRAGNYSAPSGGFVSSVDGTSGSPWLIRNYPGEAPVILGHGGAATAGRCMIISGSQFVTFRGLRFHNPTVNKSAAGQDINSSGIKINTGNDVTFEHCIVSDNFGVGFDHGSTWGGNLTLKYNLAMLNGLGNNQAHGAYLHTWNGFTNTIEGNIFINNAGYGIQCYDSHNIALFPNLHVDNIKFTRNICRKSNTLQSGGGLAVWRNDTTESNIHVREDPGTGNVVVNNVLSVISDLNLHRLNNNIGMIVRSNYFQKGVVEFRHNWQNNFFENNRIVSGAAPAMVVSPGTEPGGPSGPTTIDGFTLDDNVYNLYGSSTAWQFLAVARTFATWKSSTGQDAASTGNTTNPTDTTRFIFQSTVDTNIIHFAILNEDAGATETIDFAAYWPPCGRITIRNAGNYDGTPVVNDVAYTGQTFTLPFSSSSLTYQQSLDDAMGTLSPSLEFYAGIAVRTPANPTLTQP